MLAVGTDVAVQDSMFTLVDRETGRVLALRADITPQIARIVATRLRDEPKPVRLAYVTNVFRYDEPRVSHYREFYQAGVELIGLSKPEAEVEVIAMAIEGLRALGLERFQLDLSHPDFFRGLLEEVKTDRRAPARAARRRWRARTWARSSAWWASWRRPLTWAMRCARCRRCSATRPSWSERPRSRATSARRAPSPTWPRCTGC